MVESGRIEEPRLGVLVGLALALAAVAAADALTTRRGETRVLIDGEWVPIDRAPRAPAGPPLGAPEPGDEDGGEGGRVERLFHERRPDGQRP